MRVCWIFMILLGCRLSHASECQTYKYHLDTVCVPDGGTVSVPCPNVTGDEVSFTFIRDEVVIYNRTCHFEQMNRCRLNITVGAGVALHEHNRSVSFNLTKVNNGSQGIYRCDAAVAYPPPYENVKSTLWILVLIDGHHCYKKNPEKVEPKPAVPDLAVWIWICVTVVLIIYGTAVTIIAVVNYMKFKHSDSQSDYMNTKPRAPKDRKKKRGLENPIPRHF